MHRKLTLLASSILLLLALVVVIMPLQAQGGILPLNQAVGGTLTSIQNRQEWLFTAQPNTTVTLNVTRTGGTAPLTLQMFNPSGNIVVNINTNDEGTALLPSLFLEGGNYRVVLTGNFSESTDPVAYLVMISTPEGEITTAPSTTITLPSPSPEPESGSLRLEIGVPFEGEIAIPGEILRFAFLGFADNYITFGMHSPETSDVDPTLQLRAPDGSIIAESDGYYGTPNALVVHLQLPETGVYELIASSQNDATGEFLIGVGADFILYDVDRGVGEHNSPIIASIENMGVRDVWYVDLEAGELITVSVEAWGNESIDPMVEIVTPSGETLAFDDDGGEDRNALLTGISAPESGRYRIHVAVYDHGSAGAYRLLWRADSRFPTATPTETLPSPSVDEFSVPTMTPTPSSTATIESLPPAPMLVADRGSTEGTLDDGETFVRRIPLTAGDRLTLYVEGFAGFDGILEVYDPDDVRIDRVDDVGSGQSYDINPRLTLITDQDGTFEIHVYGFENSGGEFTLNWSVE